LNDNINLDDNINIINNNLKKTKNKIDASITMNSNDIFELYKKKEITVEEIINKYALLEYNYDILLANNNRLINNLDNPSVDILYKKYIDKLYGREL
jgi:hypothetical protein